MKPLALLVLLVTQASWAGPSGVSFSGQISSSTTGKPLTATNVDFYLKILSPSGCILYSESHLGKNLSSSQGTFDIVLGQGTSPNNVYDSGTPQSASALRKVFDNNVGSIGSLSGAESSECTSTNYTPGSTDVRRVRVEFDAHNGDGLQVVSPYHTVRNVPFSYFAQQADDAKMLGGKPATDYLESSQLAAAESDPTVKTYAKSDLPTCGVNEVLKSNGTSFSCVSDQVGAGAPIATTTSTGVVQIGGGLSVDVAGLLSVDYTTVKSNLSYSIGDLKTSLGAAQFPDATCSADKTLTWSAVTDAFSCTAISIASTAVSDFSTAVDARIAADSSLVRNPVVTSIDVNDQNLTSTGYITMNPNKSLHLSNTNSDPAGLTAADKGKMWFRADLNEIRYWNGTAAVALGAAGSGVQSINGLTDNSQTIAVDALGTDVALNSATGTHTLSIPSASATNRGVLTSADWTLFNSKLGAVSNSADLANNKIWIGDAGGKAQEATVSGDVTISNTGVTTIGAGKVDSGKILDGSIIGTDLDLTGVINATTGLVLKDSTGKFNNYTCGTDSNVLTWTATGWSCEPPVPLLPSLADGKIWVGDGTNAAVAQTVSGDATISNTGILTLANSGVTAGTYSKVTVDAKGRVTVGADIASLDVTTALGYTPLNKAGDTMGGALGLNSVTSDPAGLGAGDKGKVWYRSDLNEVRYWNGTTAVALGAAGAGVQSINGLTDNSQSIVINSSGTDVAINSASGTHTVSIPSASATNRGVLTSADWTTFNSKLGTATAFSGDVSGTYNATSVDKIKGTAVSATGPTGGQFLVYDGTTQYSPIALSGDATMDATGAVTLKNTGTAGTYAKVTTDAQGRVTSGTTLSASDIPALDWSKITTGLPTTLSGYGITDGVKNIAGTPSIETGTLAARPAFGTAGRLYVASDNNTLYRDTGAAWVAIGDGTGAGGTVTSVTSANSDISIANTTTTPELTLNSGTTGGAGDANKIAKLDASGLLTTAMIPNLDISKLTSGILPIDRGGTNSATALNNNRVMVSNGGAIVEGAAITANRALISDANGIPTQSAVTNVELGYLSGVTSAVQTQLDGMAKLAGRSGGQNLQGGTAANENLTLDSTANATKGYVLLNPTGGNVGIGTSTPAIKLDVAGAVRVGTDATACAVGVAGAIRYNAGNVEFCNGTTWTAFAASGAGITSFNGLTDNTQTFVVNSTGTDIGFNSASGTHTLSIPSSSATNRGVLTSADWTTFNNKLGTATAFSGDVSGTYNATSVDKIKGTAVSATGPTGGQFLVYDGTTQYSPIALSGDATMDATGAVTLKNTGTAGTYAKVTTDAQGRVTSGTTLSASDIPALDWSKITTGLPTTLSGYGITDGVQNLGGTPSVQTGTLAARPAFGTAGRLYIASDNNTLYRDTGAAWVAIGDGTGSGGTVTSVTSANSDISIANTTTTPVLTLNAGTTGGAGDANKIAKLDASGLLTTAMIPNLDISKLTSGVLPIDRGGTNSATALNNNRVMVSNGGAIVEGAAITANRALISDANGIPTQSAVTNTELGHLSGVTSAVQTQLDGMAKLAGRSGGQNLQGGTAASENLTLDSTANATKGYVLLNPTGGNVGIGTSTPAIKLDVAGAVRVGTDATACAVGVAGAIRYNAGNVEFCNGTTWTAFAASGAGITSLNGLTTNTQTFAIPGTTGTAPGWVSSGSAHTLNIPMANTATVTAGLISKTEYDTFNAKLGTATAFSGDVSGTYNATSVDKIKGTAVTITSLTNKNYLKYNGTAWVNAAIDAASDLTGILPVANGGTGANSLGSGNLLVGNGTGAVTSLSAGTAGNVVYASGIATWSSASPDTAGLVDKTTTQVISGAKAFTNYVQMSQQNELRFADSDSTNYISFRSPATVGTNVTLTLPDTAGSNGQVLTTNGSGVLSWSTPAAGGGALSSITAATATNTIDNLNFAQTWNWSTASTQTPMSVNANALTTGSILNLATSNATLNSTNGLLNVANTGASTSGTIARIQSNSTAGSGLTVLANGNVGIGTSSPSAQFHLSEGALLAEGMTGTTPVSGGGVRMMWVPAKAAFRAGDISGTQWDNANIGYGSIAAGENVRASANHSAAFGFGNIASGNTAFVAGESSTASGVSAAAFGYSNTVAGSSSVALGSNNSINAAASNSFAAGYSNQVNEDYSVALGQANTTAAVVDAIAIGNYNTANATQSLAMGSSSTTSARYSVAIGNSATADSYAQTTIGSYNMPKGSETTGSWVATDPLFVLGNGTGSGASRSNAMMILKNGSVGIGTSAPVDTLSISTAPVASATRAQVNFSNTALSGGSANGTYLGMNPAAFTGDLINFQVGDSTKFKVSNTGVITGDGSGLTNISGAISGLTSGRVALSTGATTVGDSANFTFNSTTGAMAIGGTTPAFTSAGALTVQGASGSATTVGNSGTTSSLVLQSGSGGISLAGNTSISGSNTFSTGTGAVTLNGNTTVSGSNTFSTGTGAVTLNGATTVSGTNTFATGTGNVSLNGATTVAANQNFSMASGTGAFTQTYTGTTTDAASIIANSITTGTLLNLTTSSASINSTDGLLYVANTSATTNGVIARIQSNSTAGSGLTVLANGNVGIGTTTPATGTKLQVAGVMASTLTNAATPTSIDLSASNFYYTTTACSGATWTLSNMAEGTTYTIAVQNNTHTGSCIFALAGSTFRYQPANATPASGHVVYSLMKVGTVVYVSWIDAFN